MSVKNTVAVYINGINRTATTVMPLKFGNFLDERLDECTLSLRMIDQKNFAPLTPVEIVLRNEIYFGVKKKYTVESNEKVKHFVVANDNATEALIGKGLYNHELYLIEVTKVAECIVVDTLTFTNDLGRNYAANETYITPIGEIHGYLENNRLYDYYKTPSSIDSTIQVQPITWLNGGYKIISQAKIDITFPNRDIKTYDDNYTTAIPLLLSELGTYTIRYYGRYGTGNSTYDFSYSLSVVENKLPLKKWTVTEVINRTLDLAEPLRKGEKPRFRLNGMRADGKIITEDNKKDGEEVGQAAKFDKILAPEFAFTKQTLRECLQDVGKFIHGEPRLKIKKDENGYYYEVFYDMYAGQEQSGIYYMPYTSKTSQHVIDNYTCWLDSNAENLVNQLDKLGGVIVEPYAGGAKSVRTENNYVRIEEGNMLIATQYPIYSVEKLEYAYRTGISLSGEVKFLDITPWLFEKSVYDSQLSSYSEQYPYSKAYGLYYTQGDKNIGGLNFKLDAATFQAFKNNAIINILRQAFGNSDYKVGDYPDMCFRVTYTPFYNARVTQTKSNYKDFPRPAALIYNQQSNVIESRYYGENLKGAIARLGNIEASLTYYLAQLDEIPQAGQKFQDDYYISAVAVEYLPTIIKCTIGISKDFNRLSSYIGVSSVKRFSEISQNQAVERNVLYREYVVIGDKEEPDSDTAMGEIMLTYIAVTFGQSLPLPPITNVTAWGASYKGNQVGEYVSLPVISSAFGNSISFSWKYEDNYSAGAFSDLKQNAFESGAKGYFQNSLPYNDYYGRIYYYNFDLREKGTVLTGLNLWKTARELPKSEEPKNNYGFISTKGKPFILRKDSREALQVNYQIDFVTNRNDIIIGSALASYCPAVRGADEKLRAKMYVFPTELNKFTDHVEAFEDVDLSTLPTVEFTANVDGIDGEGFITITADNFPVDGKAWAIVTAQYKGEPVMVEDETGEPFEQKEVYGGDLLIGQNIDIVAGQAFTPIYLTKKREIFDKSVWKDRR